MASASKFGSASTLETGDEGVELESLFMRTAVCTALNTPETLLPSDGRLMVPCFDLDFSFPDGLVQGDPSHSRPTFC